MAAIEEGERAMGAWLPPLARTAAAERALCSIRLCAAVPPCRRAVLDGRRVEGRADGACSTWAREPAHPLPDWAWVSLMRRQHRLPSSSSLRTAGRATSARRGRERNRPIIYGAPPWRFTLGCLCAKRFTTKRALHRPFWAAQPISAMTRRPAACHRPCDLSWTRP